MFYKVDKPQSGDLLRVKRNAGYYHFGIASSKNTIVHFTGADGDLAPDNGGIMIRETSLKKFLNGDELQAKNSCKSPFKPKEIIARARSFIGQTTFRGKPYNIVTNNCEHFARYVFEGSAESLQTEVTVDNVKKTAKIAGKTLTSKVSQFMKKITKK